MLLTVLLLTACAPREPMETRSTAADTRRGSSTGVTVFGDARLGVTF
jgi:hypothetical protein